MTKIRTVVHEGQRWCSLNDLKEAGTDPDLQKEGLAMLKVGHECGRPHGEIISMIFGAILATGLGDLPPLFPPDNPDAQSHAA